MGSALLGGLIEKLGVTNVPLRTYGLSEYLLGEYALDSGHMQRLVADWVHRHSKPIRLGGVNIIDRDSQTPRPFSDVERVSEDLERLMSTRFETIESLYRACVTVFAKSVTYKDVDTGGDAFIDYCIDFGEHGDRARELHDAYLDAFEDVRMIHLHRDFEGWINSIAAQKFAKREIGNRLSFRLKSWVKHYSNYENAVAGLPGLHLDFRELFSTPIEKLAEKIRQFADLPARDVDWRQENYDLYGRTVPFDKAFTPADEGIVYLDRFAQRYFARFSSNPELVGLKEKVIARFLYLWGYGRYKLQGY